MSKVIINSKKAPEPIGPYSQAVKLNGFIFISGQIALDPVTGKLVMENIKEETTQVMKNLSAILYAAESNLQNVVKCSIFLRNIHDFATVNEVYGKYFQTDPPARETVEVSRLPKNVNVEISCIATY